MLKSLFRKPQALDIPQALQQAVAFHQRGRLDEAEPLYRAILEAQPDHFDARHLLGVIRLQQRRPEEALALITEALRIRPAAHEALSNAGLALQALKREAEAVASYDRAIAIKPDYADAIFNRGNAMFTLGRQGEALQSYDHALTLRPDHATAWWGRGATLESLGRADDAKASFERALALRPDYPEALNNLGNILAAEGHFDEAITCYERALAGRPDFADVLNNRGNALRALNRNGEAIDDYQKAVALAPTFAEPLYNLGIVLHSLNRLDEAVDAYQRSIAVRPRHGATLQNCGNALCDLGRHDEALAIFEEAMAIDPGLNYLLGDVAQARARLCVWDDRDSMTDRLVDGVRSGKVVALPGVLLGEVDDPAIHLACAVLHAQVKCPAVTAGDVPNRHAHERIRIAYLSADLHDHPVAYLIAELIERHDRDRFEITGLTFGTERRGAMRDRLISGFDDFHDVRGKSDAEAAGLLRDLEIDIAIDLMGWSKDARPGILAARPAPIQVTYLGYPGTTGTTFIDYVVADRFVIPEEARANYSEKVVYLPDCYMVNDSTRVVAERMPTRKEAGLPERGFVFCAFNNHHKIKPDVFAVWVRLLRHIEGSVLWLRQGCPTAEDNLRHAAAQRGVDPHRLIFAPGLAMDEHLARHRLADLFIDTFPYNAHMTTSDALWAGLPVLTRAGKSFASRVAGSLLHTIGLPELVTTNLQEYESLALELASKPLRLREMRDKLVQNRLAAPLFDTGRFRRHIESAYCTMWEAQQRGDPPASFRVEAVGI